MSLRKTIKHTYKELKNISLYGKEAHYFLIISQERTGSTLLSDLISFHPSILIDRHYFYSPENWPSNWQEGRTIYSQKPVRGCKFKMTDTPLQSDAERVRRFLETTAADMGIIRLERNNTFRQALSACLVDRRNQLHVRTDGKKNTGKPYTIDVEDLLGRIQYFERLTRFQDQVLADLAHCEVTYESDLQRQDRHQTTANRVFRYLGLEPAPVETRFRKMTPTTLSDVISNLDEVVEALSESEYSEYLSSVDVSVEDR